MTQNDRALLWSTFNQDAERYDRARPGYPAGSFDDLAEQASIGPGSRVLEIGPGTGQATRPLAEQDCRAVAVELDPDTPVRADAQAGDRHPQRPPRPRPVQPVRARDTPPLRMGPAVHDRRLHRSPPHLLRTPRPRPRSPAQPARLHRPPDRHWLRRPDHQALPDRAAGRSDRRPSIHGSGVVGGPPPGSVRCAASRPAELVQETSHSALPEPRPQFRRVPGQIDEPAPVLNPVGYN
jgi:hypothetical protein